MSIMVNGAANRRFDSKLSGGVAGRGGVGYSGYGGSEMTLHEELVIRNRAGELEQQGKAEEGMRLVKTIPLPPWMAKMLKEKVGVDYLRQSGWNLSEAEKAYGQDWLDR
jgi:hypothetical protein